MIGLVMLVGGCATRRAIPPGAAPQVQVIAPDAAAVRPTATGDVPYVYYYEVEVYYQPVTKIYWWFNGVSWISSPQLPASYVLQEAAHVLVNLNDTEPWKQHEFVRKQYPHSEQNHAGK